MSHRARHNAMNRDVPEPEVTVSVIGLQEAQPETQWPDLQLSDFVEIPELEMPKVTDVLNLPEIDLSEILTVPESLDLTEIFKIPDDIQLAEIIKIPENLQLSEILNIPESIQLPEIQLPELNLPFLPTLELPKITLPELPLSDMFQLPDIEMPSIPLLENINLAEFRMSQLQLPELPGLSGLAGMPGLPMGWKPMKVVSCLGAVVVVVMMVLSVIPPKLLVIFGWQGDRVSLCMPEEPPGCYPGKDQDYMLIADVLYVVFLITDVFATVFTCIELQVEDEEAKNKYHMQSVAVGLVSVSSLVTWLTMFPVCFTQESTQEAAVEWKYVGAWTAAVGLFTAVLSPDEDENEGDGGDDPGLEEEFNEDDAGLDDEFNEDDAGVDDELDDEEIEEEEPEEEETKEEKKKEEKKKEEEEEKDDKKKDKPEDKKDKKEDKNRSKEEDKKAKSDESEALRGDRSSGGGAKDAFGEQEVVARHAAGSECVAAPTTAMEASVEGDDGGHGDREER